MAIRFATKDDFDFLIEGIEDVRRNEKYKDIRAKSKDKTGCRQAIKKKNVRIIESDGEIAGYLYFMENFKLMYINDKFLWIQRSYVRNKFRGKGLARKLYDDAIKIAK